jgi:hypothetical protein
MSTPREYVLTVSNIEIQGIRSHVAVSKEPESKINGDFIPVIEKTPEVVRKLECFDELVRHLEFLMDIDPASGEVLTLEKYQEIEDLIKKAKGE